MPITFTKRVVAGGDDGFTKVGDFFNNGFGYAGFGTDAASFDFNAFFRFTNVTIPIRAKIVSAKLTLEAWQSETDQMNLQIHLADADNPAAPTSAAEHAALSRTTSKGDWDFSNAWVVNTQYDTADFGVAVQEVVNRSGWTNGNAMIVLIDNDTGVDDDRKAKSYESSTSDCALLTIEYRLPGNVRMISVK